MLSVVFFFLSFLLEESGVFVKLSALLSVQKENQRKEISFPLSCRKEFVTPNTAVAQEPGDKTKFPGYIVTHKSFMCISLVIFFLVSSSDFESMFESQALVNKVLPKKPKQTNPKNQSPAQDPMKSTVPNSLIHIGSSPAALFYLTFYILDNNVPVKGRCVCQNSGISFAELSQFP